MFDTDPIRYPRGGTLLDPYTGTPQREVAGELPLVSTRGVPLTHEENFRRGWRGGDLSETTSSRSMLAGLPDHIQEMLSKSAGETGPFAGLRPPTADSSMYSVMRYNIIADTSITGAAEAIMVPAFNFYNSEMTVGKQLKFTLIGSQSENATPGTFIYRMRWGGVTGAIQVASSTLTPSNSATATTNGFVLEFWLTCRSTGATGTMWCQGRLECPSLLLAAATGTNISTYLLNLQIPATGAAIGANIDTTAALGPSPTYQPSASTANCTTHIALLECQN